MIVGGIEKLPADDGFPFHYIVALWAGLDALWGTLCYLFEIPELSLVGISFHFFTIQFADFFWLAPLIRKSKVNKPTSRFKFL
jgi:hypothetical protein